MCKHNSTVQTNFDKLQFMWKNKSWTIKEHKIKSVATKSQVIYLCVNYSMTVEILKLVTEKNINSTKFPTISNEESCGQCLSQSRFSDIPGCQFVLTSYHVLLYDTKQSTEAASRDIVYKSTKKICSTYSVTHFPYYCVLSVQDISWCFILEDTFHIFLFFFLKK